MLKFHRDEISDENFEIKCQTLKLQTIWVAVGRGGRQVVGGGSCGIAVGRWSILWINHLQFSELSEASMVQCSFHAQLIIYYEGWGLVGRGEVPGLKRFADHYSIGHT